MPLYAVHVLLEIRFKEVEQETVPAWENIFLVESDSEDQARRIGIQRGLEASGDDSGTFRWDGKSAAWNLVGVRKVVRCDGELADLHEGIEITFNQFEFQSVDDVTSFLQGESVRLVVDF